jgi:hypothetical protein
MRASVRLFVERGGERLKRAAPNVIVAGLVAAACVPIVLPLVGAGGIGAAPGGLVVLLQDYGRGYLSDFRQGRDRSPSPSRAGQEPSPAAVQARLEAELLARFEADDAGAIALRDEASLLLRSIGGVQVALEAATTDVKAALAQGFAELGATFEEFRWMLGEVRYTLIDIRDAQTEQLSLQRGQHDLKREQLIKLNLLISMQEGRPKAQVPVEVSDGPPGGHLPPA